VQAYGANIMRRIMQNGPSIVDAQGSLLRIKATWQCSFACQFFHLYAHLLGHSSAVFSLANRKHTLQTIAQK
jgi:hypothetical protein